jgi:hypothetical protein
MNSEIKSCITITKYDLYNNNYDIQTLEYNMLKRNISQWDVMITQDLTPDFCVKYLLDEKYSTSDKERYICNLTVLNWQPDISEKELEEACKRIWNNEEK